MADFPSYAMPAPPVLTYANLDSYGAGDVLLGQTLGAAASATWPVNNKGYYYPFRLTAWATAYQLLFWVGATSSGNLDVGIYDSQKDKIVSAGSTAMSATVNTVQEINIADTVLPPGDYFIGVSCSTTGGTCFRASAQSDEGVLPIMAVYEETSALPLPATATPVICTDTVPPLFAAGIQLRSVF